MISLIYGIWRTDANELIQQKQTHTHRKQTYCDQRRQREREKLKVWYQHIQASLVAQMVKNLPAMQEILVWSLGWEDPSEKEMATWSSIFAGRIPWTEEPSRLQSMESQRVRHDWGTNTFTFMNIYTLIDRVALVVRSLPANAGDIRDVGLIPGSGRAPGGGHSNPLQYSCLENPMDRGAWCAS